MASSSMDFLKTIILPTKELEFRYTLASILVARTPNVASAAIFWHVLLSSSLSSLVSVSLGLAFSSPTCSL